MEEENQQTFDFVNCSTLDKHPNQLNPEVASKSSELNQNLLQCAQWLRNNKDKAGSSKYIKHLNALETMANKGYPMAEFEYAKFLRDEGELNRAAIYFERAQNNENAGPALKKEINNQAPNSSNEPEPEQKNNNAQAKPKAPHKVKGNSQQSRLQRILSSGAKRTVYEKAKAMKALQEKNEGYLPHHSYIPPKDDN